MSEATLLPGPPAVPDRPPADVTCSACGSRVSGHYFEIEGKTLCEGCRYQAEEEHADPGGSPAFLRALLWGGGAALGGALAYGALMFFTEHEYAIGSIFVGWLVGAAVLKASRQKGGRRFQVLAAALAYLSIALAATPFVLKGVEEASNETEVKAPAKAGGTPTSADPAKVQTSKPARAAKEAEMSALDLVMGVFLILLLVLAAPFLGGFQNILGIFILGLGVYQAWRLNKKKELTILGPFSTR